MAGVPEGVDSMNDAFIACWKDELLQCAWQGLEAIEKQTGTLYYTSLRMRSEQSDATAAQLAANIRETSDREINEAGIRQLIHRGREKFAELLLQEVVRSLDADGAVERVEEELAILQLLPYCRSALAAWKASQ
jgi:hypothetical protein